MARKTATVKTPHTSKKIVDEITANYPDTEGMDLSEVDPSLTEKQQIAADKKEIKARKVKTPMEYIGAPIPATKVFTRPMPQFKNCVAVSLMAFNEIEQTVTFFNLYNGTLPASYNPTTYTYKYNPKVHDKKISEMTEIEVTEFPAFIVNAHRVKSPAKKSFECEKCGHSLKRMKFKDEKVAAITCPDCGWRPAPSTKSK